MKHEFEKLQEEMKVKDQEVVIIEYSDIIVGFSKTES